VDQYGSLSDLLTDILWTYDSLKTECMLSQTAGVRYTRATFVDPRSAKRLWQYSWSRQWTSTTQTLELSAGWNRWMLRRRATPPPNCCFAITFIRRVTPASWTTAPPQSLSQSAGESEKHRIVASSD